MRSQREPGLMLPVTVTLVVLLGLYVAAYALMTEPTPANFMPGGWRVVPAYPEWIEHDFADRVFVPVHWLDRKIRPHVWEI